MGKWFVRWQKKCEICQYRAKTLHMLFYWLSDEHVLFQCYLIALAHYSYTADRSVVWRRLQGIAKVVKTSLRDNKLYYVVYKTCCYLVFRAVGPLVALLILTMYWHSLGGCTGRSARTQHVSHQSSARHATSTSETVVDDVQSSFQAPRERDADLSRCRVCLHCRSAVSVFTTTTRNLATTTTSSSCRRCSSLRVCLHRRSAVSPVVSSILQHGMLQRRQLLVVVVVVVVRRCVSVFIVAQQ